MVKFGERIRALASSLGKEEQQIAKDLNLTKSQLSHYINGNRKVPSDLLQQIVDTYRINPLFLFREDEPLYGLKENPKNDYNFLPTAISAGLPINIEGITQADKVSLPDSIMGKWAGNKEIYVTKISGDSMDKVMSDGSLIAVKPVTLDEIKDGDMIVFSDNHEYSVKYYHRKDDKLIFKPSSNNEAHYDQMYSVDDNITIHGRVVMYIVELD